MSRHCLSLGFMTNDHTGFLLILKCLQYEIYCVFFPPFSSIRATSATTHVVLGQFKTCVILLGGFHLFGSNPGSTSILGAATALVGMSFYTYLNLNSRHQSTTKISSRQSSALPISKSKLGKENGENHYGDGGEEHVWLDLRKKLSKAFTNPAGIMYKFFVRF